MAPMAPLDDTGRSPYGGGGASPPSASYFGSRPFAARAPTKLSLGVLDQPYGNAKKPTTTYKVAVMLERHYGLFSLFWQAHGHGVATDMEDSLKVAFEAMLLGHPVHPYASAMDKIEHRFRRFLSNREVERMQFAPRSRVADRALLTIPTRAALLGIRHRHKKVSRGPRRPSFIDTGLLQTSFRAFVS